MIEITRLFSVGDRIAISIDGAVRRGVVTASEPLLYVVIDCSTNKLQPCSEKYYWVAGVENWMPEARYKALGPPPAERHPADPKG